MVSKKLPLMPCICGYVPSDSRDKHKARCKQLAKYISDVLNTPGIGKEMKDKGIQSVALSYGIHPDTLRRRVSGRNGAKRRVFLKCALCKELCQRGKLSKHVLEKHPELPLEYRPRPLNGAVGTYCRVCGALVTAFTEYYTVARHLHKNSTEHPNSESISVKGALTNLPIGKIGGTTIETQLPTEGADGGNPRKDFQLLTQLITEINLLTSAYNSNRVELSALRKEFTEYKIRVSEVMTALR